MTNQKLLNGPLYVRENIIPFFRLQAPLSCLLFYAINAILDVFDGAVARRLDQSSAFGATLDFWIDVLGRGVLWTTATEVFQHH